MVFRNIWMAFKNISDTTYLINQLFENPSVHLDEKVVKSATLKLQKIQDLIKSVSEDLDHDESDS